MQFTVVVNTRLQERYMVIVARKQRPEILSVMRTAAAAAVYVGTFVPGGVPGLDDVHV